MPSFSQTETSTSASQKKAADQQLAKDLLARASGLAKDLRDDERAFILSRLSQASVRLDKEKSEQWADETFRISESLPEDVWRSQYEITAMMAMAENDSDRAMKMLYRIELTVPRSGGPPTADMRTNADVMLFQKIWQKRNIKGLETLQTAARTMGEGGNYPYEAMGYIIREVGTKDRERATSLTREAVSYFSRRNRNLQSDAQFVRFLQTDRNLLVAATVKDALDQLLADVLNSNSGASNQVLLDLLPMVRENDPARAAKIESQYATQLSSAQESRGQFDLTPFIRDLNGGDSPVNLEEEVKAIEVDELAGQDMNRALQRAKDIQDPTVRAATLARLAGDLKSSDPNKSAELLSHAREALADAKDSSEKLRILVGLSQGQVGADDRDGFAQTLDAAYSAGDQLVRKSVDRSPDAATNLRPAIDLLTRLTIAGIRFNREGTLQDLDQMPSSVLKAVLTIAAARGIDSADVESSANSNPRE